MRRISSLLLSLLAVSLVGPAISITGPARSAAGQDADKGKDKAKSKAKSPLDGAWRLVSAKDLASGEMRKLPEGIELFKLVVDGRFVWTFVQKDRATAGAGGHYTLEDDRFTENVDFAISPGQQAMTGKSFTFSWKIEDGKWYHKGTLKIGDAEQEIDQIYERVP